MRIGFKISPKRFIFRGAFVRMIEFLSFSVRWTSYRRIIPIFNSQGYQDHIPAAYKPNGTFVSMKNVTLDQRLGVSLSATEVTTAW